MKTKPRKKSKTKEKTTHYKITNLRLPVLLPLPKFLANQRRKRNRTRKTNALNVISSDTIIAIMLLIQK